MIKIISIILYLVFSVGGLILVKSGSEGLNISFRDGTFNFSMAIKAIVGFLLYIGSFIIYTFYIIRKFDLSYIFPIITGITQIAVILAGVFIFKENISVWGYVGIISIIIGVVLLNIK